MQEVTLEHRLVSLYAHKQLTNDEISRLGLPSGTVLRRNPGRLMGTDTRKQTGSGAGVKMREQRQTMLKMSA